MRFAIVTPSFQPGHFLVETLKSVISQAGDFAIAYHVQDGGSTDGSIDILKSQVEQIEKGNVAIQCRELSFSYSSEPDRGMYDALNKGFRYLLKRESVDIMLWINSDDRLASNALSQLNLFFSDKPDVNWVIGRTLHLNEEGKKIVDIPPRIYESENLSAGRHDGKNLCFVTQEATAWRSRLWSQCGELDSTLRYAGDFEYWVRAARNGYSLHSANLKIGYHRKRIGQLSAVGCYAEEVKLVLADKFVEEA